MQALTPWTSTTPPCAGWWNASTERDADTRRYWNGTAWSAPCYLSDPQEYHDRARATPGESQSPDVEWRGLDADSMDDDDLDLLIDAYQSAPTFRDDPADFALSALLVWDLLAYRVARLKAQGVFGAD